METFDDIELLKPALNKHGLDAIDIDSEIEWPHPPMDALYKAYPPFNIWEYIIPVTISIIGNIYLIFMCYYINYIFVMKNRRAKRKLNKQVRLNKKRNTRSAISHSVSPYNKNASLFEEDSEGRLFINPNKMIITVLQEGECLFKNDVSIERPQIHMSGVRQFFKKRS